MTELLTHAQNDFAQTVLAGLSQPQKVVPARFLFDKRGSELFERVAQMPERYQTGAEAALLHRHAGDIAELAGFGCAVVEFGSGSSAKTPILLDAVRPSTYIPVDISADFLAEAATATAEARPGLRVVPVAGDFTLPVFLDTIAGDARRLGFFPGGTIGNFGPSAAVDLLRSFATTLGRDSLLVIGLDPRKDSDVLLAAADDPGGLMRDFNLNLLERINRELGGTIDADAFAHKAVWNDLLGRLELHIEAVRDHEFSVAGRPFAIRAGETIHTENSYKYRPEEIQLLGRAAGWEPIATWTESNDLFSLQVWSAAQERIEP